MKFFKVKIKGVALACLLCAAIYNSSKRTAAAPPAKFQQNHASKKARIARRFWLARAEDRILNSSRRAVVKGVRKLSLYPKPLF
ncbi:MAG: hypothetical protein SOZ73_01690, partial [Campylobacter sp.]|nr:hypothetical protein [Campylobacter sp.]